MLIALGALLAVAAPLIFSRISSHEVKDVVEERVAITAREMWRAGEWVLPTLNGRPRLEKPPLAYWLVEATAFLRGKFDDVTLRLPFAFLALGAVSFAFGTGCLLLGTEGGLPYRPFVAFGAAVALIAIPYGAVQGRISRLVSLKPQDFPLRSECELAARLLGPGESLFAVGATMSSLPGGMVYYLDVLVRFVPPSPLEDLGRRLRELPADSWLLVPYRYLEPCLPGRGSARESGAPRLGGPVEGYRLVTVVNPGAARDRDLVCLLKK